jgi:hypothetical protein
MTFTGMSKQLRVVGVYVALFAGGWGSSWIANEALTADGGILWPAKAKGQITDLQASNVKRAGENALNAQDIAEVKQDVAALRTDVADVKEITTAVLRWVCLQPDFSRYSECRRVYR